MVLLLHCNVVVLVIQRVYGLLLTVIVIVIVIMIGCMVMVIMYGIAIDFSFLYGTV